MTLRGRSTSPAFPDDYDVYDLPPEYKKEGQDWFAMYNPKVKRTLEVDLMHTLMHERFVLSSSPCRVACLGELMDCSIVLSVVCDSAQMASTWRLGAIGRRKSTTRRQESRHAC